MEPSESSHSRERESPASGEAKGDAADVEAKGDTDLPGAAGASQNHRWPSAQKSMGSPAIDGFP